MIEGVLFIRDFCAEPEALFDKLLNVVSWDNTMSARKTASFGVAYNYSQMHYPDREMLPDIANLIKGIDHVLGFKPNNCLINLYEDGKSRMGYHSDQVDILADNTGVAIVSLGERRSLTFRRIVDHSEVVSYALPSGSLLYMYPKVQILWQHAVPKMATPNPRMSLTFRKIG